MGEILETLKGYSIYKCRHDSAGDYYLCIPNGQIERFQLFIGFADMDLSGLPKEAVIAEVRKISDLIHTVNSNGILMLPDLPVSELEQAARENDDRKYNDILNNRIQPITAEIFKMIVQNKGLENGLSQTINMVKNNDRDKKLAGWMAMKLGSSFINEVDMEKLREEAVEMENGRKSEQDNKPKNMLEPQNDNTMSQNFSSGIAPIDRSYEQEAPVQTQQRQNRLVRKRVKENEMSPGFGNIKFIIAVLLSSLVVGISVGYLLIK